MRFLIFAASLCIATTAQAGRDAPCGSYLEAIGLETELATQDPCSPLEELVITRLDPDASRMDVSRKLYALSGDDEPFKVFETSRRLSDQPDTRVGKLATTSTGMAYILLIAWDRDRSKRFQTYKTWFDFLEWQAISQMVSDPYKVDAQTMVNGLGSHERTRNGECAFDHDAFNLPFETLLQARVVRDCLEQAD